MPSQGPSGPRSAHAQPGSRLTFLLVQESKQRSTARTALAPRLRQGVPGFATKAGVGQKLPAFAALTAVKQSARASSRGPLRGHPCLGRKPGGAEGQLPNSQQPNPAIRSLPAHHHSRSGCWGSAPFAPPALAPRQGRAPKARHPSSSARLSDRSEQGERREFLAGPCFGSRDGYSLAKPRSERIRGLNFCLLLVQAKRRCGCRGAQPLRALSKSAHLLIQPRTSPCPNTTHL